MSQVKLKEESFHSGECIHPGVQLKRQLIHLGIPLGRVADHIGMKPSMFSAFCNGKRGLDSNLAWKLSSLMGSTPQYWMNLWVNYLLAKNKPASGNLPKPLVNDKGVIWSNLPDGDGKYRAIQLKLNEGNLP